MLLGCDGNHCMWGVCVTFKGDNAIDALDYKPFCSAYGCKGFKDLFTGCVSFDQSTTNFCLFEKCLYITFLTLADTVPDAGPKLLRGLQLKSVYVTIGTSFTKHTNK